MKLNLKQQSQASEPLKTTIIVEERLPEHLPSACTLNVEVQVKEFNDYYLMDIKNQGMVDILCQRCLQVFAYEFKQQNQLAVCKTEMAAERLMQDYECIVEGNHVNLVDILTDNLHLYLPQKHLQFEKCDSDISKKIGTSTSKNP